MSARATIPTVDVETAARRLRAGAVGAFPTETLYGLAAVATEAAAVRRLVEIKGREPGKPIAVLVDGPAMLDRLVRTVPEPAARLAAAFWPGPLTLVFDAAADLDPALTGGSGTIGVRVSSCAEATALVRAVGEPLTAPSANPAGAPPPRRLAEVWTYFGDRLSFYLDGGDLPGEPASTVADVRGELRILRAGAVSAERIAVVLAG